MAIIDRINNYKTNASLFASLAFWINLKICQSNRKQTLKGPENINFKNDLHKLIEIAMNISCNMEPF